MKTNLLKLGVFASILIIPLGLRLFPAVEPSIQTPLTVPRAAGQPYPGQIYIGTATSPVSCSGGSCPYMNQGAPSPDGISTDGTGAPSCH